MRAIVTTAFTGYDDPLLSTALEKIAQPNVHLFPDRALNIGDNFDVGAEFTSEIIIDQVNNIFLIEMVG